ncbi:MAG: hypothetical protein ABI780_13715, partial [Ardenticatenales bacterium]
LWHDGRLVVDAWSGATGADGSVPPSTPDGGRTVVLRSDGGRATIEWEVAWPTRFGAESDPPAGLACAPLAVVDAIYLPSANRP